MGTRGCYGLRKDGLDKLTYNHYDSYPSCLGQSMFDFIQSTSIEEMKNIFDKIVLVKDNDMPSDEELILWKLTEKIGTEKFDWYWLLRDTQGDLSYYKQDDAKYMIDNQGFIQDSLFCEWAYIVNLDTSELEVYKGFQHEPHENRYTDYVYESNSGDKYYPCKLIATYPLDNIPDGVMEVLEKQSYSESA
jgi:hypothetical protein